MPTVVINAGHKADPVDLTPNDPDRGQHVNDSPDYVVVHHGVGLFARGDLVSKDDLGKGVDVDRLLRLGAILPVEKPAAKK